MKHTSSVSIIILRSLLLTRAKLVEASLATSGKKSICSTNLGISNCTLILFYSRSIDSDYDGDGSLTPLWSDQRTFDTDWLSYCTIVRTVL